LKDSIKAKLDNVSERHEEIAALLGDADTISDQNRFRDLSREYSQLEPVVKAYADYKTTTDDLESAREMADDPDPDMRDMAKDEIATAEAKLESLNLDLQKLLLPLTLKVRVRCAPRTARARDRIAGQNPHVCSNGCGIA